MDMKKTLLAGLCALVILGGTNYLLNQSNAPVANAANAEQEVGGAAQFVGKHDIKDSPYYAHPDFYNMQSNEHLTLLPKFSTTQQITPYTCGPAAANMVVKYYKGDIIDDELAVGKIMSTSSTVGTNTKGMVKYFEKLGWEVHSSVKDKTRRLSSKTWTGAVIGASSSAMTPWAQSMRATMCSSLPTPSTRQTTCRTATALYQLNASSICGLTISFSRKVSKNANG